MAPPRESVGFAVNCPIDTRRCGSRAVAGYRHASQPWCCADMSAAGGGDMTRRHVLGLSAAMALGFSGKSPQAVAALFPIDETAAAESSAVSGGAQVAQAYDSYARSYNALDGAESQLPRALGFNRMRRELLGQASGNVLEVGCGTGENLQFYDAALPHIDSITCLDISRGMLEQAELARADAAQRWGDAGRSVPVEFVCGDSARLPFADASFDTVVDTFSLCVFPEPLASLREMRRVLKTTADSGVLLIEHSLSSNPGLAAYQNLTAQPVARVSKGCFWNQDVPHLARAAGLRVVYEKRYLAGSVRVLRCVRDVAV